jgi:hypothetical protein
VHAGSKVAAIAAKFPAESVLGWFVNLKKLVLNPSTVEETVTQQLAHVLQHHSEQDASQVPLLFGLFSSSKDYEGATIGFQHRLMQQNTYSSRYATTWLHVTSSH